MTEFVIETLSDIECNLGESALWDDRRSRLYWVDITGQMVYARDWDTGETKSLELPDMVGCVGLREGGGLVAAMRHSIVHCDVDTGAVQIVLQCCRALGAAHAKGIVHRDMKPENIFLTSRDGVQDFVKIVDFGIAKMSDIETPGAPGRKLTKTGMIFGTSPWSSSLN